ncbi:hypothetical protein N7535_004113 [Penicillium sp. DV-2018c]|nr:hypothetical protein N7461_000181 [Penicillium sp. DV-2018c]KAJ5577187.1 hypothetical protein N7535_004113 [Penicillium sp. DV-2018c]
MAPSGSNARDCLKSFSAWQSDTPPGDNSDQLCPQIGDVLGASSPYTSLDETNTTQVKEANVTPLAVISLVGSAAAASG